MPALTAAAVPVATHFKASEVDTPALVAADKAARISAVEAIVSRIQNDGPIVFKQIGFVDGILASLADKKNALVREAAANAVQLLATKGAAKHLEPYVFADPSTGIFNALLEALWDKVLPVKTAAQEALSALIAGASPWATAIILPTLLEKIKTHGKWQVKIGCLNILKEFVKTAPAQTASLTPDIIPVLEGTIWDTKKEVQTSARATLKATTALVSNKDIVNFIPALIKALTNPVEEVCTRSIVK